VAVKRGACNILPTKLVQQRTQAQDYLEIDAPIRHGIDLPRILAVGTVVYGRSFNPLITLKAVSYFDDLPMVPE